ncbi:MAG: hypothetical protein J6V40_01260 [Clostridia bacterium]|nr:hypothetical protein [Clostridia bacterium]
MKKPLDSILDSFLSKGYEECTGEKDVVELHREHGVCIKIKKEFFNYSIKLLIHSQVKMLGTVARQLINDTIAELDKGLVVDSGFSYDYVEIKISGSKLTYRMLEHCVDIFYMNFQERYLGLIQSAQMRMYHMEEKSESYDKLHTPSKIGEYRDTSHEGRVHSDPNVTYTRDYTKDYTTSTGTSSTYSNYNDRSSYNAKINVTPKAVKFFIFGFIAVFVILFIIGVMVPTEYDINGYLFNAYDWEADGYVDEVNARTYEGETYDGYAYAYLYELEYDSDTLYTEVVNDVNKYINYLMYEHHFVESFTAYEWTLSGVDYETTYEVSLSNNDTIYFGIEEYHNYGAYRVDIIFVYEDIYITGA